MTAEHMEISSGKQANDPISWEEMQKMKYTWRVAQETLRVIPPVFGGFRKAVKDVKYKGYIIPSGWQVSLFLLCCGGHWNEAKVDGIIYILY